jgi:hypothetical protein
MKFSWSEIDQHITQNYDLLIVSASFEERSLSFSQHFPACKAKNAIVFYLHENFSYLKDNLLRLKKVLNDKHITYECVELFQAKPLESTDKVYESLDKYLSGGSVQDIIIDITTFTHEIALILLAIFKRKYTQINVTFAYSNAMDYDRIDGDEKRLGDKWLSKGSGEIRSVLGYPGDLLPAKQTHLIIIVGYEYDRALSVISEMEPTSLSLGFGKSESYTTIASSDINGKYFGAQEHFNDVVRDAMIVVPKNNVYKFEISCNDPLKARNEIQLHLAQHGDDIKGRNIILFAMNNKLSTLGVGLFALESHDIQLCYAPALIYNYVNYSIPGEECYLFKLFCV